MKVACVLLTCGRADLTVRTIRQNFYNSGVDAPVYLIDNGSSDEDHAKVMEAYPHFASVHRFSENMGIAKALNEGIKIALDDHPDLEAIVTLANDILMPEGWLKAMIEHCQRIPDTGMVGIHTVEHLEPLNDLGVHPAYTPFGNVLIPAGVIDLIGYFNAEYDPYGMQDADYAMRLNEAGFKNYYVPNLKAEHIGHDVGDGSAYRAMKDEALGKALDIFNRNKERYQVSQDFYLPFDQSPMPTEGNKLPEANEKRILESVDKLTNSLKEYNEAEAADREEDKDLPAVTEQPVKEEAGPNELFPTENKDQVTEPPVKEEVKKDKHPNKGNKK